MRNWFARIPRETKVAAIVLGAALVQVGILSALGLFSTEQQEQQAAREFREEALRRVRVEGIEPARERLHRVERLLDRELGEGSGPLEARVGAALTASTELIGEDVLSDAIVLAGTDSVWHWRRPTYPPPPEGANRLSARREVERLETLLWTSPEAALEAATVVIRNEESRPPGEQDVRATALACQVAWRAAYRAGLPEEAKSWARHALDRYRTLVDAPDEVGAADELAVPLGLHAADLVSRIWYEAVDTLDGIRHADAFARAVRDRRMQLQRMRGRLDPVSYRLESEACRQLLTEPPRTLPSRMRLDLVEYLDECDRLDAFVDAFPPADEEARSSVERAVLLEEPTWVADAEADPERLWWLRPVTSATTERDPRPTTVAFAVDAAALRSHVLRPLTHDFEPPPGVGVFVSTLDGRPLHGDPEAPVLGEVELPRLLDGVHVRIVQLDAQLLAEESNRVRWLWVAVLAGAGLAVVAASILAVRSVLREVRLAQLKTDFVSNLSHELRTPLTGLRMFVETLQEGRVRDEAERQECLGIIAQETERLSSLVDRILQFASFSRGKAPIELVPVPVVEAVRRAVKVFEKRAESVGASLRIEASVGPETQVRADRDALVQVLLNLLDNAVKYGGENGPRIVLSVRVQGRQVRIDVEDDGPGVPERERELVFEEFYRADDLLARRTQGTGIGLALCRRIVLAHGGRIRMLASKRLGGALVRVDLPLLEEAV